MIAALSIIDDALMKASKVATNTNAVAQLLNIFMVMQRCNGQINGRSRKAIDVEVRHVVRAATASSHAVNMLN
jgi:hypothetical protein